MNILEKLIKIADLLDKKGLTQEASKIDKIITKLADDSWPKHMYNEKGQRMVSRYSPSEKEVGVITPSMVSRYSPKKPMVIRPSPKMRKWIADLRLLRNELGLPEHPKSKRLFDKELAMALQSRYPGVWKPRTKQTPMAILDAIRVQDAAFAKKNIMLKQDKDHGETVSIPPLETKTNPPVVLPPKEEFKL
jgi:hypothetical protein